MTSPRTIRIALLGAGAVGAQVARMLLQDTAAHTARSGARLELAGIAVRDLHSRRDVELPQQLFTTDAAQLVADADLVIEVMGGIEPARSLIMQALQAGTAVVTANKALLAAHGPELHAAAAASGAQLSYEAAVAGAIPILRPLLTSLAGDHITRVMGIVNGSTNYILDSMYRFDKTAAEAMRTASELGYLEADPTLDVEGYDAQQKAALLGRLAFHTELAVQAVYREGITAVSDVDMALAKAQQQVIKLLAIVERVATAAGPAVAARVYPALLPDSHPLAAVAGGKNAIFVEAENAGELMFYGAGAGGAETASAVLGDVLSTARQLVGGAPAILPTPYQQLPAVPFAENTTAYQLRVAAVDLPAVVSAAQAHAAAAGVTLSTQFEFAGQQVLVTAPAAEAQLQQFTAALKADAAVAAVESVLRVEAVAL